MGTTPQSTAAIDRRRSALAEASAWIIRLHGPHRTPDLEAGFRAWLAADPENSRQFERVTETWERAATPVPGTARVGHWPDRSASSPVRKWSLAAAMMIFVIGVGVWGASYFWLNPSYGTGIGEQRIVRLSDGTRITLNSNSRVAVTYRDQERRVRVDRGEAYFEVAQDVTRPFLVRAGDREVRALGTAFVVRYEPLRTAVTLVEGKIEVSSISTGRESSEGSGASIVLSAPSAEDTVLNPGQRVVFARSKPPKVDEPRIEAITAWRRGEVMLDNTALADAIAEMNRYDQTRLVIDDPAIARLQISGIYHTGDSKAFAKMISKLYGLEVEQEEGRIRLVKSNPASPDLSPQ
jgi:transmembrane sensor